MTGPQEHPLLAAPVSGFAAFALAKMLDNEMPRRLMSLQRQVEAGKIHPDRLAELVRTWSAVLAAAREWAQWAEWGASADGSTEDHSTEMPAGSTARAEIDTETAAALLGVTSARVRQLARGGQIDARRVGRSWLVDRCSVELRKVS